MAMALALPVLGADWTVMGDTELDPIPTVGLEGRVSRRVIRRVRLGENHVVPAALGAMPSVKAS